MALQSITLFDSYGRDTAVSGKSDIDVVVDFSETIGIRFIDLTDELEEILKQEVDLVSRKAIKQE